MSLVFLPIGAWQIFDHQDLIQLDCILNIQYEKQIINLGVNVYNLGVNTCDLGISKFTYK